MFALFFETIERRTFRHVESRPPVSLDGWSADGPTPDVLGSGSEREPRLTPAARRRLGLSVVAAIVAVAAVVAGLEVQERRSAAAEERRLAGVLRLSLTAGPWPTFVAADLPSIDVVDVYMRIPVRNDGPRDVTVTEASAGGFALIRPVALPPQTTDELLMQQEIRCAPETAPPQQRALGPLAAAGPLRVTAVTSRGTRTITIETPPDEPALAARWCDALRQP